MQKVSSQRLCDSQQNESETPFSMIVNGPMESVNSRTIVRVKTSYWADEAGLQLRRTVRFQRRKCEGVNVLENDIYDIGACEAAMLISNLMTVDDGLYDVQMEITGRDDSGLPDTWFYTLVPFQE